MAKMANVEDALDVKADIWELLGAGVIKYFEEKLLSGVVGNGTFISGVLKLGTGVLLDNFKIGGKFGDMLRTAFVIDGVEDVTTDIAKMFNGFVSPKQENNFQVI